jgi:hypothetical protein
MRAERIEIFRSASLRRICIRASCPVVMVEPREVMEVPRKARVPRRHPASKPAVGRKRDSKGIAQTA